MIAEIVFFKLSEDIDFDSLIEKYKGTAEKWANNPDLVQKWYFYDATTHEGGGVYIWRDRQAAAHWHGPEYHAMVERVYGHPPDIRILDAVLHVDATRGTYSTLDAGV